MYSAYVSIAPGRPPNVMATATSPTSIMITWDMVPPIDQNGVITMYEVLYEPLETFNGAIMSNTTTVDGMTLTAVLGGLEEFVDYTISVRAYTSAGEGPYSDGVMEMTIEDGKLSWVPLWTPSYLHFIISSCKSTK